jgi:cardiolipin synthase
VETARPTGTTGYDKVAGALLATRLRFDEVHQHVLHLFPDRPARILDVGSGPGHDAATLALRGHAVTAVEPTRELREGARALYPDLEIEWVDDSLPRLARLVAADPPSFDFILVEGVWAHLTGVERAEAFPILASLLAEGGVLAISLRHGPAAPGRIVHTVTAAETVVLAETSGLDTLVNVETGSIQASNVAAGVTWTRLAFGRSRLEGAIGAATIQSYIPSVEPCSYPPRGGNAVQALIDGEPAFRRICAAIETARHSVWTTIAFMTPEFRMPDGRGDLFDVLNRATARGLDVRVVFWRPNPEMSVFEPRTFWGSPDHRRTLAERGSGLHIRWDRALGFNCQHQKSWIVDAGQLSEVAFVGGINLNHRSVVAPGHAGEHQNHDAYVELAGPSATDVHHNFVQRWNEASERDLPGGTWGHDGDLPLPTQISAPRGDSTVQVQRTLRTDRYTNAWRHPFGRDFDAAAGETSIFEQYRLAIVAARRTIYIENQALEVPEMVAALDAALGRGVEVVLLMPAEPEAARPDDRPERLAFLKARSALARYDHFTLAGIAGLDANGQRQNVYVHAKLMLVDDAFATIGSGNLHANSLFGSTEMNAAIWDPAFVRALRCALFAEHLGLDTGSLDDLAALRLYRRVAGENRRKRDAGAGDWQGLAFTLDPATWQA